MRFEYLEEVAKRSIILDEHGRIYLSPTILFEKDGTIQMIAMNAPFKTLRTIFRAVKKKIRPRSIAVICLVDYDRNTYLFIKRWRRVRRRGKIGWKRSAKVYAIVQLEEGFDLDEVRMKHKIVLNID